MAYALAETKSTINPCFLQLSGISGPPRMERAPDPCRRFRPDPGYGGQLVDGRLPHPFQAAELPQQRFSAFGPHARYRLQLALQLAPLPPLPMERHRKSVRLVPDARQEQELGRALGEDQRLLRGWEKDPLRGSVRPLVVAFESALGQR